MAYVNVAEWKTDQVCEWLKGLDNSVLPYVHSFSNHNVNGQQLLNLRPEDLDHLGVLKLGHQETILEAVEYLRNFHYELDRENLQLLSLRLSCLTHSLFNELSRQTDLQPVSTQTLADVATIITAVKPLVCWLDRPPFSGQLEYNDKKTELLKLSLEMATCAQRDRFAEKPIEEIRTTCGQMAKLADYIVQDIADPMILQPASLDLATLKKRPGDDLGFCILPSFHGAHQIAEIKFGSAAHQCGKMEEGDEIVQVNYQTVVGWERKNVLELFRESPAEVLLTLKRRPRHTKVYGQIYIKPYRLPSNKKTPYASRWHHNLPSPRPELLTIPDFQMPLPKHTPKENSLHHHQDVPTMIDTVDMMLDTITTDSSNDSDSEIESPSSVRLYLAKPRNTVQRRATITGASPTTKHSIDIERFWRELKQEHNSTFQLRDKAASCAHGLNQVQSRPQTCLGIEQQRTLKSRNSSVFSNDEEKIPNDRETTIVADCDSKVPLEKKSSRGELEKCHSTPAYDFLIENKKNLQFPDSSEVKIVIGSVVQKINNFEKHLIRSNEKIYCERGEKSERSERSEKREKILSIEEKYSPPKVPAKKSPRGLLSERVFCDEGGKIIEGDERERRQEREKREKREKNEEKREKSEEKENRERKERRKRKEGEKLEKYEKYEENWERNEEKWGTNEEKRIKGEKWARNEEKRATEEKWSRNEEKRAKEEKWARNEEKWAKNEEERVKEENWGKNEEKRGKNEEKRVKEEKWGKSEEKQEKEGKIENFEEKQVKRMGKMEQNEEKLEKGEERRKGEERQISEERRISEEKLGKSEERRDEEENWGRNEERRAKDEEIERNEENWRKRRGIMEKSEEEEKRGGRISRNYEQEKRIGKMEKKDEKLEKRREKWANNEEERVNEEKMVKSEEKRVKSEEKVMKIDEKVAKSEEKRVNEEKMVKSEGKVVKNEEKRVKEEKVAKSEERRVKEDKIERNEERRTKEEKFSRNESNFEKSEERRAKEEKFPRNEANFERSEERRAKEEKFPRNEPNFERSEERRAKEEKFPRNEPKFEKIEEKRAKEGKFSNAEKNGAKEEKFSKNEERRAKEEKFLRNELNFERNEERRAKEEKFSRNEPSFEKIEEKRAKEEKFPRNETNFERSEERRAKEEKFPRNEVNFERSEERRAKEEKFLRNEVNFERSEERRAKEEKFPRNEPNFEKIEEKRAKEEKFPRNESNFEKIEENRAKEEKFPRNEANFERTEERRAKEEKFPRNEPNFERSEERRAKSEEKFSKNEANSERNEEKLEKNRERREKMEKNEEKTERREKTKLDVERDRKRPEVKPRLCPPEPPPRKYFSKPKVPERPRKDLHTEDAKFSETFTDFSNKSTDFSNKLTDFSNKSTDFPNKSTDFEEKSLKSLNSTAGSMNSSGNSSNSFENSRISIDNSKNSSRSDKSLKNPNSICNSMPGDSTEFIEQTALNLGEKSFEFIDELPVNFDFKNSTLDAYGYSQIYDSQEEKMTSTTERFNDSRISTLDSRTSNDSASRIFDSRISDESASRTLDSRTSDESSSRLSNESSSRNFDSRDSRDLRILGESRQLESRILGESRTLDSRMSNESRLSDSRFDSRTLDSRIYDSRFSGEARNFPRDSRTLDARFSESRFDGRSESRFDGRNESRYEARNESWNESRNEGRTESRNEGRTDSRNDSRNEGRSEGRSQNLRTPIESQLRMENALLDSTDGAGCSRQQEKPRTLEKDRGVVNRAMMVARSIGFNTSKTLTSPKTSRKRNMALAKRRNISAKELTPNDLEGWLIYRSRGAGGAWAKAWFVLKGSSLFRFKTQESPKADCLIALAGFTASQASEVKSRKHAFKVYHTGTVFYFAADTDDSLLTWLDAVSKTTVGADVADRSSGLFSETDESDGESCSRNSKLPNSESGKVFGSLKKSGKKEQNLPTGASLDRKYLKFLGKSQNVPVPTAQFRSYRRVLPSSTPRKQDSISNSPELPVTVAGSTFYGLNASRSANDVPSSSQDMGDYRRTSDRFPRTRRNDELQGFITLEEFMLSRQDDDHHHHQQQQQQQLHHHQQQQQQQQQQQNRGTPSPRFTPLTSDHVHVQHRTFDNLESARMRFARDIPNNNGVIYGFPKNYDETSSTSGGSSYGMQTPSHTFERRASEKTRDSESKNSTPRTLNCMRKKKSPEDPYYDSRLEQQQQQQQLQLQQQNRTGAHGQINPANYGCEFIGNEFRVERNNSMDFCSRRIAKNDVYSGSSGDLASHSTDTFKVQKPTVSRNGSFNLADCRRDKNHHHHQEKKMNKFEKNKLKHVGQYQPPPILNTPFEQEGMRAAFEMHLDKSEDVQKKNKLKNFFSNKSPQKPSALEIPKETQKTLLGSPRLHRALFRDKSSTQPKTKRSGSQSPGDSGISQSLSSGSASQSQTLSQSYSSVSSVSDWSPDTPASHGPKCPTGHPGCQKRSTNSRNFTSPPTLPYIPPPTSPPPDYPGLEYPPVFEPGTYSLSDASSILRSRNNKNS